MSVSRILVSFIWATALTLQSVPRVLASETFSLPTSVTTPFPRVSTPTQEPSIRSFASSAIFGQDVIPQGLSGVNMTALKSVLQPELLRGVRDFWFEHLDAEHDIALPTREHHLRWFQGGEELDKLCVELFHPAVEAIRASGVSSGNDIIEAVQPQSPLDWMSLVILLDQMPRNIYRGESSTIVFKYFDPLARDIAQAAIDRGISTKEPEIRWQFAYRTWFYLPLMHSEDLATHEEAVELYGNLAKDIESLFENPEDGSGDEYRQRAAAAAKVRGDGAREYAASGVTFEKKHYDLIKQFGRYPHRNQAMGREPTAEETEYLANGGETFGAKKN